MGYHKNNHQRVVVVVVDEFDVGVVVDINRVEMVFVHSILMWYYAWS